MGALASSLGMASGGGLSASASSSASSGPQGGSTGNLVLNFGGINLGNQDIPLTATNSAGFDQTAATVGHTPLSSPALAGLTNPQNWLQYVPLVVIGLAALALYKYAK